LSEKIVIKLVLVKRIKKKPRCLRDWEFFGPERKEIEQVPQKTPGFF
jgi:hypothetical protein